MKSSILILMALALFGLAFAPTDTTHAEQKGHLPEHAWLCEPVLLFDQTGVVGWGPTHTQLAVYNNGMVNFSRTNYPDQKPTMWSTHIPRANVQELWEDLMEAGAFELEDDPRIVTDSPITTITTFYGETNAMAHTFSFFVPRGRHGDVLRIIETFILDPIG